MSTPNAPVCSCDAVDSGPITNPPGLPQVSFRVGDFNDFRRALLTPLLAPPGQPPVEQSLAAWKSGRGAEPSVVDLGVMMVEWWAYLLDILTFYNERIANEDYLRTAVLPETPASLIKILGYRPRPAIGATGTLAALVSPSVLPGQSVTLPAGLQFQSKPGPGQSPQTFELSAATKIGAPDQVSAITPPFLVANLGGGSFGLLLQGSVTTVSNGSLLLLGRRDNTAPLALITLTAAPAPQTGAGGRKQTLLTFSGSHTSGLTAENARLSLAGQNAALWTVNGSPLNNTGKIVQLAGLARQIRPNDYIVFTAPSQTPQLVRVTQVTDVIGDANSGGSPTSVPSSDKNPILILHTQLTLASALDSGFRSAAAAVSVLFGWVDVGKLVDQPPAPWDGISTNLKPVQPAKFPPGASIPLLLQDSSGNGVAGSGSVASNGSLGVSFPKTTPTPLSPELQSPIQVLYNLLAVTRGKTVANEVIGSGDGSVAGQSFKLAKSPVTYLMKGSSFASTINLTVNGQPWTEVASFFGQPSDARVFVTREDAQQNTYVDFGDGVNGSRLPTGANNVVATYRIGAGADSPAAGKLTIIAQSYPGLQSVLNPVPVSGGSDPDPPSLLKQYAPRSVLTFGRAVSVFDFQALAAQAPGVTMAAATWSWDNSNQRGAVTIYVAGEANVAASVQTLLSAAGDPNRPVNVLPATQIPIALTIALVVTAGMDASAIQAAVGSALYDPQSGLFSPAGVGIGQVVFDSMIEAACLGVTGVLAIKSSVFSIGGVTDPGPMHIPGEGAYFSLDPSNFVHSSEAAGQ